MACARESIAALTGEQKKLRKQKVPGAWGSGRVGLRGPSRKGLGEACARSESWELRPQIPCDLTELLHLFVPLLPICKMGAVSPSRVVGEIKQMPFTYQGLKNW